MLTSDVRAGAPFRVRGKNDAVEFLMDDSAPFSILERELREYLESGHPRFRELKVHANVGNRLLNTSEIGQLRRLFDEYEVPLVEVSSGTEDLEAALSRALSIPVTLGTRRAKPVVQRAEASDTLLVPHTCRTGSSIRHPGNVVVVGNVNPGAEIIAGGNVVVIGAIWGVVHAGAGGDEKATIVAQSVQPTQLRIAGRIALGTEQGRHGALPLNAEVAYIDGGSIIVEPYHAAQREPSRNG